MPKILVGKHKRKKPLRRYGRRSEENININLRRTVFKDADWIDVDQNDRWWVVVNTVINRQVP
jgi:hypothetical protein